MIDHDDLLRAARDAVHENTPPGRYVGRPGFVERYSQWSLYAFDQSETPVVGKGLREWAAESLDESARRSSAADRGAAMSGWGTAETSAGAAVLVALVLSVGRWLGRVIRRRGR